MRVGIIDLGTNSVRFDVHQIGPGSRVRQLHREKLMIRLGQGVFLDGKLDRNAIRRALQAFSSFQKTAQDLQASHIIAFGTSALREASDSDRLLQQIRQRTGIDVRVISGKEEARLIAEGILSNEKQAKGRFALVDIGGGSVEISVCRSKTVAFSESFPLGTARLQQVFLKSSPPKTTREGNPIDQLRRYIRGVVLSKIIADEWPRVERIYGSSGTIRAIGRILKKNGKKNGARSIEIDDLKKLVKTLSTMTTTQLLGIPGMEAKRVDMILAGAILLEECMNALKAKKTIVTEYSLRDGILEEEIRLFLQQKGTHIAFHLNDLRLKARRLGVDLAHSEQVVTLSKALFDRLRPLHKLRPEWRIYLEAAGILHDTGEAISTTHHEMHSYYIVRNGDFPSMEKWETDFIAHLCRLHQGGKIEAKDLPFRDKPRRDAFMKLLAIFRVADALDRGHKAKVRIQGVRIGRGEVVLRVSGRSGVDLEILRVEQKKMLFESVFGRALRAEEA